MTITATNHHHQQPIPIYLSDGFSIRIDNINIGRNILFGEEERNKLYENVFLI